MTSPDSKDLSGSPAVGPTQQLATNAQRGDVAEMQRLYERTLPALFAWIQVHARGGMHLKCNPEDVVQEVWVRALRSMGMFDPARCSFRAWTIGIAKRVLLEQIRHGAIEHRANRDCSESSIIFDCPDSITTISRAVARDESMLRFLDYVAGLDREERMIVVHHGLEELPLAEIAVRLNLSTETVTKRWQRACARMREGAVGRDFLAET